MTWFFGLLGVALVVAITVVAALKVGSARAPVPELGVEDGRLTPCPETPNCVSTQAHPHDDAHYLAPIAFVGSAERVVGLIDDVVTARPRTKRVAREGAYLRYEFETYLMRFVDDVEFWVDAQDQAIHFRSASRFGGGDMGANRTRMRSLEEDIEDALEREGMAPETDSRARS